MNVILGNDVRDLLFVVVTFLWMGVFSLLLAHMIYYNDLKAAVKGSDAEGCARFGCASRRLGDTPALFSILSVGADPD